MTFNQFQKSFYEMKVKNCLVLVISSPKLKILVIKKNKESKE